MKRFVLAVFCTASLVSACDSCLPESWRVPPHRKFEIMAAERHRLCVQNNDCTQVSVCHAESEAYCLDAGYPKHCGNAELEGSCGTGLKR